MPINKKDGSTSIMKARWRQCSSSLRFIDSIEVQHNEPGRKWVAFRKEAIPGPAFINIYARMQGALEKIGCKKLESKEVQRTREHAIGLYFLYDSGA